MAGQGRAGQAVRSGGKEAQGMARGRDRPAAGLLHARRLAARRRALGSLSSPLLSQPHPLQPATTSPAHPPHTVPHCTAEYCQRGSLYDVLRGGLRNPAAAAELTWPLRLQMVGGRPCLWHAGRGHSTTCLPACLPASRLAAYLPRPAPRA